MKAALWSRFGYGDGVVEAMHGTSFWEEAAGRAANVDQQILALRPSP